MQYEVTGGGLRKMIFAFIETELGKKTLVIDENFTGMQSQFLVNDK